MTEVKFDQVEAIFTAFTRGQFDEFLAKCRGDLVLIVRGSDPESTYLSRTEIPDWYLSMQSLVGDDIETTVEVIRTVGTKSIVLFRHHFERKGARCQFEMINVCSFTDGRLATWISYPLNLPAYAHALRIYDASTLEPA